MFLMENAAVNLMYMDREMLPLGNAYEGGYFLGCVCPKSAPDTYDFSTATPGNVMYNFMITPQCDVQFCDSTSMWCTILRHTHCIFWSNTYDRVTMYTHI